MTNKDTLKEREANETVNYQMRAFIREFKNKFFFGSGEFTDRVSEWVEEKMLYLIEQERKKMEEYAVNQRKLINEGKYCRNESKDWKDGYECAMYDVIQALSQNTTQEEVTNGK